MVVVVLEDVTREAGSGHEQSTRRGFRCSWKIFKSLSTSSKRHENTRCYYSANIILELHMLVQKSYHHHQQPDKSS
jgi:hypothetical protein